jgi:hypothetical protein
MKRWAPITLLVVAPWLPIAACSGGTVAATTDAAGQDATLGDDSAQPSLDGGSSEGDVADAKPSCPADDGGDDGDGGASCTYLSDATPDVARGATCTASAKAQRWAAMVQKPIILPNRAGGLDLRGGACAALTLAEAEGINCQSDDQGDLFGDGRRVATWGDNAEFWMHYDPCTGVGTFFVAWQGYLGTLDFKSPDGGSSYSIAVLRQITKDGNPFTLDTGWSGAAFEAEVDELYRGIVATFEPGTTLAAPGTTCVSTQKCKVGNFGAPGYVYIPELGFALWVGDRTAAQPGPSIPNRFDVDLVK